MGTHDVFSLCLLQSGGSGDGKRLVPREGRHATVEMVNLWILALSVLYFALNVLYCGEDWELGALRPSRAQARLIERLARRVGEVFRSKRNLVFDEGAIRDFMRMEMNAWLQGDDGGLIAVGCACRAAGEGSVCGHR